MTTFRMKMVFETSITFHISLQCKVIYHPKVFTFPPLLFTEQSKDIVGHQIELEHRDCKHLPLHQDVIDVVDIPECLIITFEVVAL